MVYREKTKYVQLKLTQQEINNLRTVTNKGTTYEALYAAVVFTIENMKSQQVEVKEV